MQVNKLIPLTLSCLVGSALVLAGSLMAAEPASSTERHITVGERALPCEEQEQLKEKRAVAMKDRADLQGEEEQNNGAQPSQMMQEASAIQKQAMARKSEDAPVEKKASHKAIYYTTHPGAFHSPIAVSVFGETVQLEDGSVWSISSYDRYNVLNWFLSDDIVITPNSDIFSSYSYRLNNQQTGASVAANMTPLGPVYNGIYTHWIVAIDYLHGQICLEDGSIWNMSVFDSSIVNKWLPNDTVIIGVNNGIFSSSNPNILINVNVNQYAIGTCIFY